MPFPLIVRRAMPRWLARSPPLPADAPDPAPGWLPRTLGQEREAWILWLPVAVGLGIVLYFALPAEPWPLLFPLALVAGLAVLAVVPPWLIPTLAARAGVAVLAGAVLAQAGAARVQAPVLAHPLGPTVIEGRVRQVEPLPHGWRVVLEDLALERPRAVTLPHRARLRVHAKAAPDGAMPPPGTRIALLARLEPPRWPARPGGYDLARALWFKGIGAVGYALGPISVRPAPASPSDHALAGFFVRLEAVRAHVTARLIAGGPGATGPLAAALLTGERRAVPEPVQEALRGAGLAHLLAISGLHMSMVGGLVFVGVRAVMALCPPLALGWPIKKLAALVALAACLGYLALSGASVPSQRAFLMTGLVFLAVIVDRRALSMRSVALAALVVLAARPDSLLGPSFQMSFSAVIALIAAYEALSRYRARTRAPRGARAGGFAPGRRLGLYVGGLLLTTIIATLATTPFSAFHFHRVALYGLAANAVGVPLMGTWVMPWGLAALALMPLGLEHWALVPMGWGLDVIVWAARGVSSWPGAQVAVPDGPAWALGLAALGGLWLCLWRQPWRWAGVPVIAAAMMVPFLTPTPDVLVGPAGKLVAVRADDGGLLVSDRRRERFARQVWTEAHGGEAGRFPGEGTSALAPLRCDALACLYQRHGVTVALPRTAEGVVHAAGQADVVVAGAWTVPPDTPAPVIIDRPRLEREGAWALWIDKNGHVRARSVAETRGRRPWTATPAP
ncbi:ComEC/Rec2 family competence protein [Pararhodospirillum oryzae]|uniref:Competence protein ComEC n=1 Tax=Pararhodospirillum oryzae TaxID=478448 RepID=A0A512H670_9PROT|nr:ComEC/Rec2 family competence protein [Pararhodospirillum oryzae]GEO80924.1 competence protein ComEC [Pararhodospirillum oryzae]